jgi:hypothetical protein
MPSSSGSYSVYVNVTDSLGVTVKSNVATTTVNTTPSVGILPAFATMLIGESQMFTSSVSGGTSPYSYRWYLNGSSVSGATDAYWIFTPSSIGSYNVYVTVTDAAGVVATSTTFTVTVAAFIPEFPQLSPLILLLSIASALILALAKRRKPKRN